MYVIWVVVVVVIGKGGGALGGRKVPFDAFCANHKYATLRLRRQTRSSSF